MAGRGGEACCLHPHARVAVGLTLPSPVIRALLGWSQRDLARAEDVHVNTVRYWERQHARLRVNADIQKESIRLNEELNLVFAW